MAYKINTVFLCTREVIGAKGTAGTFDSDPIDLRNLASRGVCSLTGVKASTTGLGVTGTVGSASYQYLGCALRDGDYGTFGTFGTDGAGLGVTKFAFTPDVFPFMKVRVITGTSNPLVLTSQLNVA